MTHIAYAYRSGHIVIMLSDVTMPEGVIPFARGPHAALEKIISARSRHARDADVYLVPNLPEAQDGDAVRVFVAWLDWAFPGCPVVDGVREVS